MPLGAGPRMAQRYGLDRAMPLSTMPTQSAGWGLIGQTLGKSLRWTQRRADWADWAGWADSGQVAALDSEEGSVAIRNCLSNNGGDQRSLERQLWRSEIAWQRWWRSEID